MSYVMRPTRTSDKETPSSLHRQEETFKGPWIIVPDTLQGMRLYIQDIISGLGKKKSEKCPGKRFK